MIQDSLRNQKISQPTDSGAGQAQQATTEPAQFSAMRDAHRASPAEVARDLLDAQRAYEALPTHERVMNREAMEAVRDMPGPGEAVLKQGDGSRREITRSYHQEKGEQMIHEVFGGTAKLIGSLLMDLIPGFGLAEDLLEKASLLRNAPTLPEQQYRSDRCKGY